MVSIKDIAKLCNCSTATVSKALNDHCDVSVKTKERIREVAKANGYLPNSAARSLKIGKSYHVGVLLVDQAESGLKHYYFSSILDSFKVVMERNGYDLTFLSHQIGDTTCSYYEHCRYRSLDAVLAACVDFESEEIQELLASDIPIVSIDHVSKGNYTVVSDNASGIREAVEYVIGLGHKNIAYIYGDDTQVTKVRVQAFRETLATHGIELHEEYLRAGKYLFPELSFARTVELLDLAELPTCIFYPDDVCAVAGMTAISGKGYTVKKDISVVGFDGMPLLRMLRPHLTTVEQDTRAIGSRAAEMMLKILQHRIIGEDERVHVCKGSFLEGETVGQAPLSI